VGLQSRLRGRFQQPVIVGDEGIQIGPEQDCAGQMQGVEAAQPGTLEFPRPVDDCPGKGHEVELTKQ